MYNLFIDLSSAVRITAGYFQSTLDFNFLAQLNNLQREGFNVMPSFETVNINICMKAL